MYGMPERRNITLYGFCPPPFIPHMKDYERAVIADMLNRGELPVYFMDRAPWPNRPTRFENAVFYCDFGYHGSDHFQHELMRGRMAVEFRRICSSGDTAAAWTPRPVRPVAAPLPDGFPAELVHELDGFLPN